MRHRQHILDSLTQRLVCGCVRADDCVRVWVLANVNPSMASFQTSTNAIVLHRELSSQRASDRPLHCRTNVHAFISRRRCALQFEYFELRPMVFRPHQRRLLRITTGPLYLLQFLFIKPSANNCYRKHWHIDCAAACLPIGNMLQMVWKQGNVWSVKYWSGSRFGRRICDRQRCSWGVVLLDRPASNGIFSEFVHLCIWPFLTVSFRCAITHVPNCLTIAIGITRPLRFLWSICALEKHLIKDSSTKNTVLTPGEPDKSWFWCSFTDF